MPGAGNRSASYARVMVPEHDLRGLEKAAGIARRDLEALLILDQVKGFGPAAFRALTESKISPERVIQDPSLLPLAGRRAESIREKIGSLSVREFELARERSARQIERAAETSVRILTHASKDYPRNLYESNNPVPLLYAAGDLRLLRHREVVACVGSRKTRPRYLEQLRRFVSLAVDHQWIVASGFANGADTTAHEAAVASHGGTVLVMPSGLDIPFPPENKGLWAAWQGREGIAMISEFPLGTKASALTLRKRNKTIVGVSLMVLVAQTGRKGGTMNSYRFAVEQKKPVLTFAPDGLADTDGNRLIGEEEGGRLDVYLSDPKYVRQAARWIEQSSSI
jgi:DNA processing protein